MILPTLFVSSRTRALRVKIFIPTIAAFPFIHYISINSAGMMPQRHIAPPLKKNGTTGQWGTGG